MSSGPPHPPGLEDALSYPFFQSVFDRKSRRMALGMEMSGTLAYASPYEPVPLTELEEALLLVAGTGLTGLNLGDIDPSMGADALVQWTARTWPSSCSNHGTELFFTNDDGLWFLDMWNLIPEKGELSTLQGKSLDAQVDWILELVRGAKKRLSPGRAEMPTGLPGLFVFNHWNANMPGTTLFLPVSNMTLEYINLLFIYFSPEYRFTLVDETNGFVPARARALDRRRPARPRPPDGHRRARAAGAVDAGRRAGLHLPEHQPGPAGDGARGLDLHRLHRPLRPRGHGRAGARLPLRRWRKRGPSVPVGRDGVFEAFMPPYHDDMGAAVDAFLETKWSQYEPDKPKAYLEPDRVVSQIVRPDDDTIQIVKDYCTYVHDTYGRFPAYLDPMYQRLTGPGPARRPRLLRAVLPAGRADRAAPRALRALAPRDGRRRRPAASARGLS